MTTKIEIPKQKMLKDFLHDNNWFKSYPRTLPESNNNNSGQNLLTQATTTLPRSRSKSRASADAMFRKLLNAVKSLHYSGTSTTPLTLPRSVSRRFLRIWSKKREKCSGEVINSKIMVVSVKVKDILRWRSFRDLIIDNNGITNHDYYHNYDVNINVNDDYEEEVCEVVMEESQPLDFVVGSSFDAPMINDDFTVTDDEVEVEKLPCWSAGEKLDEVEFDDALDTHVGPKKDNHNMASEEDIEQQSPVSILESPFRDEVSDEEFLSPFDQSLANMERTKQRLLQSIQMFESLAGVYEEDDPEEEEDAEEVEEFESREEDGANEAKSKGYLSRGLCWFKRGGKGLEEKIECVKGMDEQRHWGKFQEERIELGVELGVGLLSDLLDEVVIDFFE